jgi:hypothetical protein
VPNQGGTIYAIGAQGTPLVKIGSTSKAVATRLAQLQTGQPFVLHVIAAANVEGNLSKIEHQIHIFLQAEQRRGEWFETTMDVPKLEALILRAVQELALQEQPALWELEPQAQREQQKVPMALQGLRIDLQEALEEVQRVYETAEKDIYHILQIATEVAGLIKASLDAFMTTKQDMQGNPAWPDTPEEKARAQAMYEKTLLAIDRIPQMFPPTLPIWLLRRAGPVAMDHAM